MGEEASILRVLLEREPELARIGGRLQSARSGDGGLTVIEGTAGIGKTSLLREVRRQARRAGMCVLEGRGSELERDFAFGVVRQALERAVSELEDAERAAIMAGQAAHAAPLFDPTQSAASSESLLHGLYWLIANLAEQRPIVLAIDDAHWADESSITALAFLARRAEQLPLALVVSSRPADLATQTLLARLLSDPTAERLTPEPIGENSIAVISGSDDPAFVRAATDATGGNPFLLDQLLRELGHERRPEAVAQVKPRELGRIVLSRIGDTSRALAWALVILGDGASGAQCAMLGEVDDPMAAVTELVASGILADEDQLRFRHPLIGAAVASSLTGGQRARWHARAAAILATGGADSERIAVHLAASEPAASPQTVAVLLDAADRALARGAPVSAESLLRRALAEPPDATRRPGVLLALGDVLTVTGEEEAAAIFAEVLRSSDSPLVRTRAMEARARVGWARASASVDRDLAEIDRLIASVAEDADGLRLRLEAARLGVAQRSAAAMDSAVARAEQIGLFSEHGLQHPDVLAHVAYWRMQTGHCAEECVAYAQRAVAAASDAYRSIPPGLWFPFTTIVLQAAGRLDEATSSARVMQQATRDYGSPAWYGLTTQWHAWLLHDSGDLVRAEEEARLAVDATAGAEEDWMRALPVRTLVSVLLDRGQLSEARRAWAVLGVSEAIPDNRPMNELLPTRARLRRAEGDLAGSLDDLREASRRHARSRPSSISDQDIRLQTALLELATGEREAARATAAEALAIAERWGTPGATGVALRVQGLVDRDLELLRAAHEQLTHSPFRLEQAKASAELGATLRRDGARREAREPLLTALACARECGAEELALHVGDELAASGVRVPPRPRTGTDALTPSERRIARMAAEGTTNKEIAQALFLSVKTVEMHLRNTFRKLDVESRRELGAALG